MTTGVMAAAPVVGQRPIFGLGLTSLNAADQEDASEWLNRPFAREDDGLPKDAEVGAILAGLVA